MTNVANLAAAVAPKTNVKQPAPAKPRKEQRSSVGDRKFQLRLRQQAFAGCFVGAVGAVLTSLSLHHLAQGISVVTKAPTWEAWAMAIAIDLGFVALEMAQILVATEITRKKIWLAKPAIVGTLIGSAAMNAFAFAAQAEGLMVYPAVLFGLAIPALLFCLTKVGAALYLDCHKAA